MNLKNDLRIIKEGLVIGVLIGLIFNITTTQSLVNQTIEKVNKNTKLQEKAQDDDLAQDNFNLSVIKILKVIIPSIKYNSEFIDYQFTHEVKKVLNQDKYEYLKMLKKLQQVNVFIVGTGTIKKRFSKKEISWSGSGVTLKYKNKFYILSAAHLLSTDDAKLEMYENDVFISELEVVKVDVASDLLLLQPTTSNIEPKYYTELADYEITTAQEIIAVGNPAGLEDVVSTGRVITYYTKYMIISDTTYFGSSGGGIYNTNGDLIGIVSAGSNVGAPYPNQPYYVDFEIRLNIIKEFLSDIQ